MRSVVARRLLTSVSLLGCVVVIGSSIFWLLGRGRWSWLDCVYFTVITLSTIGYGETLPGFEATPWARGFTMLLILAGTGSVVYVASNVTALVVEGGLRDALRLSRSRRAAARLSKHVILCGCGRTGTAALASLLKGRYAVVAVDASEARVAWLRDNHPEVHAFVGDASDDEVLRDLGIARAHGVIVALGNDRDTLFTVLSARSLSASARILARARESAAVQKLERAGADRVVFETGLAGMRIASEMVRPIVNEFIDAVVHNPQHPMQFAEILVQTGAAVEGRTLGAIQLRKHADVIVVAVRLPDGKHQFNPTSDTQLTSGAVLMVLGAQDQIVRARAFVARVGDEPAGGAAVATA
jgi:voltage-gated potassium channel